MEDGISFRNFEILDHLKFLLKPGEDDIEHWLKISKGIPDYQILSQEQIIKILWRMMERTMKKTRKKDRLCQDQSYEVKEVMQRVSSYTERVLQIWKFYYDHLFQTV